MDAELLKVLASLGDKLPVVITMLNDLDSIPGLWALPGLNRLQPYEAKLKEFVTFLYDLDKQLAPPTA